MNGQQVGGLNNAVIFVNASKLFVGIKVAHKHTVCSI